jgi:hypothetical protein
MKGKFLRTFCVMAVAVAVLAGVTDDGRALEMRLSSHPVVIYYNPNEERVARRVAEICEERLDELCAQVGLAQAPPVDIEITDDVDRYRRRFGGDLPRWGVAFAIMGEGKMVVDVERATRAWNSLEAVIPHEFSHLLVAARLPRTPLPIWFLEGLAQWQAGEWSLVDSWQLMNAVWSNKAPMLWQLQNHYPEGEEIARNAYRVSYAAFTRLFEGRTHEISAFLDEVERQGGFEPGFLEYFGEYPMSFYVRFQESLQNKYYSRLMVFQTGPLFSVLAAAFLIVAIRFYIRKRRRLKEMPDGPVGEIRVDHVHGDD